MASIVSDASGNKLIKFKYGGKSFTKSADTKDAKSAASTKARVEDTIRAIKQGWLSLPDGADVAEFIISAGNRTTKAKVEPAEAARSLTLAELLGKYDAEFPAGAKDPSTMSLERTHKKHLLRTLRPGTKIAAFRLEHFQTYANVRSRESWQGKPISPTTIVKELSTFRVIWNWALRLGYIAAPLPYKMDDITFSRTEDKPPFQTYEAIIRTIQRGGLSDAEQSALWESMYLTLDEVHEVLDYVKENSKRPYVYPMFAFVAMTGARRSEICRSRVDDWDFENSAVKLREKKRKRGTASYRVIEVNSLLEGVMQPWVELHPGGQYIITKAGNPLTVSIAHNEFKYALKNHTKWRNIPGFHTFRHSFASILASEGVDEAIIDRFMGHQTVEQRERYRHLFPKHRKRATELLARPRP